MNLLGGMQLDLEMGWEVNMCRIILMDSKTFSLVQTIHTHRIYHKH